MHKARLLLGGLLVIVAAAVLTVSQTNAFSIRELLGLDEPAEPDAEAAGAKDAADPGKNWAQPQKGAAAEPLSFQDMQTLLANVDAAQRQAVLSEEDAFRRFVRQEADNHSLLAAAEANELHKEPNTIFLMERAAENVLREHYLNRLIASKIPADFPTEQQLTEYFEKNREQFVVPQRVYVWQIFLPVGGGEGAAGADAQMKRAQQILKDLNEKKIDFAGAALQYSGHADSRLNGGYMGLVKVSDLKPEISKPLLALPEGKTSDPVKTDTGIHILRRGAKVDAEPLSLEMVRPQVRQLMLNQVRNQLRAAIFEQARKSYPVAITDQKIEEWRLRLKTNTTTPTASSK